MKRIYRFFLMVALTGMVAGLRAQNTGFLKTYRVRKGNLYDRLVVTGATFSPMYPDLVFISFLQQDINESGSRHYGMMVLDTAGNLRKTLTYLTTNTAINVRKYYKDNIFIDVNGDIYLAGYKDNLGYWDGDGLIMKVDTHANAWFGRMIGSWDGSSQHDHDIGITVVKTLNIAAIPPLYVVGSVDQFPGSFNDKQVPFIAELNKTTGAVKDYKEIATNASVPYAFYPLPAGKIAIWAREFSTGTNHRDIWLQLDTGLTLLSAPIAVSYQHYSFDPLPGSAILTSNNDQVVAGICRDTLGKVQLYCYSLTVAGGVNWAKVYAFGPGLLSTSSPQVVSILEKDSSLYLLAKATIRQHPYDADFMILNIQRSTGQLNWIKYQGTNYEGESRSMEVKKLLRHGNHLYVVGDYLSSVSGNSIFLLKTDLHGNWTKDCYDNIAYDSITVVDASVTTSNLLFGLDSSLVQTVVAVQVQNFIDTMAGEVVPPHAAAMIPALTCPNDSFAVTDSSTHHYSWNYRYTDGGYWYSGSPYKMAPGITDYKVLSTPGTDSLIIYAYDISHMVWGGIPLCSDSAVYTFTVLPTTLNPGFTYAPSGNGIRFTDTSTGTVRWRWDFGDSTTDTVRNPFHVYATPGPYTVCLTAWNLCGDSATVCHTVVISSLGAAPSDPIQVYPTHTTGRVTIRARAMIRHVEIFNATGQKVAAYPAMARHAVSVTLPPEPGIYWVRIFAGTTVKTTRIIRQ